MPPFLKIDLAPYHASSMISHRRGIMGASCRKWGQIVVLAILLAILPSRLAYGAPMAQSIHTLIYNIDYTGVPDLTYYDLTLQVTVGTIESAIVRAGGEVIPHEYSLTDGILQFTVDTSPVSIELTNVADATTIGQVEKATLKHDLKWAWSLGFDDNGGLETTVAMLESYGYRGTIYQIGNIIHETRDEEWIIDKIDMLTYIDNGWSMGNHTWDHACYFAEDHTPTIIDGYNRIVGIVNESNQPNYKVISFAAPCFDTDYHPYIINMRDSGTTAVQFNESGGEFPMTVDADITTDFVLDGKNVFAFDFDQAIPRDVRIEFDVPATISEIDWIAAHTSPNRHFWYNSLSHGGNLTEVQEVVDYVYNTYGANGTNEVWVAPADHIYSYLLVRELSVVTLTTNISGKPTSTPTGTPSPSRSTLTPTSTSVPAAQPTDPPTATATSTPRSRSTSAPTRTPHISSATKTPTAPPISTSKSTTAATSGGISIEVSNISGVASYEIGIFGSGFEQSQGGGSLQILGAQSQILEWNDQFIHAVVPEVADGTGNLTVNTDLGGQASITFTVYTIDPTFKQVPRYWFENVAYDKPATISNLDSSFCFQQPDNVVLTPQEFLFNYQCGFAGITNTGKATFNTPATIGLQETNGLSGEYYLQFFTESSWYTFHDVPATYDIQVSADSTDGLDGTWLTLTSVNNNRTTRFHRITVPEGDYQWLRLNVLAGTGSSGQFDIREMRLYKPIGDEAGLWDSLAIYGDSLTVSAFEAIGPSGISSKVKQLRDSSDDMIFSLYGLTGQNSTGLLDSTSDIDIYDALIVDDMGNRVTYWGIALGTNDSLDGAAGVATSGTNVDQFDDRLDAIVQELISRNRIPTIARIPDTVEAIGGFGDLAAKKKILADIDTVMAQYKLIPGPDLYTAFRRNRETEGGSYFGNDGTHHSAIGQQVLRELWAEAFVTGTPNILRPGQVTQIAPVGNVTTPTLTFTWEILATSDAYKLVIYQVDTQEIVFIQTYDAAEICGASGCVVQPTAGELTLSFAAFQWLIQAMNQAGNGPWIQYSP